MNKLYLILCILGWGISIFLNRLALEKMHPLYIQASASIVGLLLFPIYLAILHQTNKIGNYSISGFIYASIAFVLSVLAAFCLHSYVKNGNVLGSAVAFTSTYPVITILLSYLFLGETFSNSKIIGIILIICGSIAINI